MTYLEPDGGTRPEGDLPHDLSVPDDLSSLEEASDDRPPLDEVPDDLSSLEEEVTLALVLTQVASAEALAAAGALHGLAIDAVDSPVGAIAVCRDRGGSGPATVASSLSATVKGVPVVLLLRRGGQVTAQRWLNGEPGDDLPAGLVLSDAPAIIEDLVLGTTTVADLSGTVTSVGVSRWKAMRMLAAQARSARRKTE